MSEPSRAASVLLWQEDLADRLEVLERESSKDRWRVGGTWLLIAAIGLVAEVAGPEFVLAAAYPAHRLYLLSLRRRARERECEALHAGQKWLSRSAV